ncbi:MAG: ATP-binding cassette domain-containing protein [Rhodospirillaceae bacterium]|nr:ATP-binding cassette domain-containing protein [Rhodospirillaceae bacterium]
MILSLHDMGYRYADGGTALAGITLTLAARRIALLGSNGAGKTTLLLHLNGSLRPSSGGLCLDGVPARYDRAALRAWRQKVALVLQDPDDQLFAATVAEDVSFGPTNLGLVEAEIRSRVDTALADMDITDLRARATHALSFGQRKRVAIAGALAMDPEILVLDEPSAGLDSSGTEHLLRTLERLAGRGVQIVFSTHDADLAYRFADVFVLLRAGEVVGQGAAEIVGANAQAFERAQVAPPLVPQLLQRLATPYPELGDAKAIRSPAALLEQLKELELTANNAARIRAGS